MAQERVIGAAVCLLQSGLDDLIRDVSGEASGVAGHDFSHHVR
jgi:hypothetical protein